MVALTCSPGTPPSTPDSPLLSGAPPPAGPAARSTAGHLLSFLHPPSLPAQGEGRRVGTAPLPPAACRCPAVCRRPSVAGLGSAHRGAAPAPSTAGHRLSFLSRTPALAARRWPVPALSTTSPPLHNSRGPVWW